MKICEYGCGKEGKYQFKNGKWCCENNISKCLEVRKKISKFVKELWENPNSKLNSEGRAEKISKALKGENNHMFGKTPSKETRKKMSEALKGKSYEELYGKEKAEEIKKKRSEALKNPSKETRKKMSESHKNPSKETRKKMSESHKNPSKEIRKKMSESMKGKNNPMFGKTPSEETRKKQRLAAINRIEKNRGQISPNYNPEACKLIEEYSIENGYNFQHAENGGEFYINELGYWVDGYDKNKNIVIEVDESHHFDVYGNLCMKDLERQQEIINFLGCRFIRLRIE